jgi:hypothetical protein
MDNLAKLQRRKAELEAQIEQQRADLKKTFLEIREEIEPSKLLKKALSGALNFSGSKPGDPENGTVKRLPGPIAFLVDVLVKDPRLAVGLKLLTPVVLKYWPKFERSKKADDVVIPETTAMPETVVEKPAKLKFYGRLREGISAFRGKLRKTDKASDSTTETTEN